MVSECKRNNLCVDCDNKECWLAGDIQADCPKYRCAFEYGCERCGFIKRYAERMRETYGKG